MLPRPTNRVPLTAPSVTHRVFRVSLHRLLHIHHQTSRTTLQLKFRRVPCIDRLGWAAAHPVRMSICNVASITLDP